MDPNEYALAYSQRIARLSIRYASQSSSGVLPRATAAMPALTTTTTALTPSLPFRDISNSNPTAIVLANSAAAASSKPPLHPRFWPLLFAFLQRHFLAFWTAHLQYPVLYVLLPALTVWILAKFILFVSPDLQIHPLSLHLHAIREGWRRDWHLVRDRLRVNSLRDSLRLYRSRFRNFLLDHFLAVFLACFAIWFVAGRVATSLEEGPMDLRGKGFRIPEYMIWGRRDDPEGQERSAHVGAYREEEWVEGVLGGGEDENVVRGEGGNLLWVDGEGSSSLPESSTSSLSAPVGGIPDLSPEEEENRLAYCKFCGQMHCCEIL